jgi:hypothetical protein
MEKNQKKSGEGQSQKARSYKIFLNELLDGSFMTKEGIRKNYRLGLLVVGLIFLYISNHYAVIMRLSEIDSLQKELTEAKYEALTRTSELMRESRQSNVLDLIHSKGLNLEEASIPHFTLAKKDSNETN